MLLSSQQPPRHKHFKHPIIATASGVVLGLIVIAISYYAIYSSGNHIADCKRPQIYPMYHLDGQFDKNTLVSLCSSKDFVQIHWEITDPDIVSNFENCHDPLYKQDSVGVTFISPLYRYVNNYYTFIISPKGMVYSQDSSPYYGTHSHVFDCDQINATIKRTSLGWKAQLLIPVQKIGKGNIMATQITNFFRIDVSKNSQTKVSINDKFQTQSIRSYVQFAEASLKPQTKLTINDQ